VLPLPVPTPGDGGHFSLQSHLTLELGELPFAAVAPQASAVRVSNVPVEQVGR
jgi:hypothetical protein